MTAHGREHGPEPVPGLPGPLPEGERILWQGAPDWRVLARTALHVRWIVGWFALLAVWRVGAGLTAGSAPMVIAGDVAVTALLGAAAVGLLSGYAWLVARTTIYTLTDRRFVLRHGVALQKSFNVPYRRVESAGLKLDGAGFGDMPLRLTPESKIGWPHLWPHARPLRIVHPEPMMRAVPDAAAVAGILTRAWSAELGLAAQAAEASPTSTRPVRVPARRRRPAGEQTAVA